MAGALESRINARVPKRVKDDLSALARRRRVDESELARALLDEAIRRENHPGIVFRATPVGKEAAIEGRRLYVWQVMETVWASDGDRAQAAESLGVRRDQVEAAVAYCADYKDEIDELIKLNHEEAERLQRASALQEQALRR